MLYSVLLIEDNYQHAKIVKRILEKNDFLVVVEDNGEEALENIKKRDYDLYLIDINIPGINGVELVRYIRELKEDANIIMITASDDEYDFRKSYEHGCDDYIKKPFKAAEIEVRVNHLLKRKASLKWDGYEFVWESGDLFKDGKLVDLTKKERKLLFLLLNNVNLTVKKDKIIEYVWGENYQKEPPIRQLVKQLREKFDKDYIKTIVATGYRFEIES
ncbi:MAG: response regulator transcription factor [Nautiliaceae bacterium]